MVVLQKKIPNMYYDSVSLMQLSSRLSGMSGIQQASIVMASENNLNLLTEAGLLKEKEKPSPGDIIIVIQGKDEKFVETALKEAENTLSSRLKLEKREGVLKDTAMKSIEMALGQMPDANLALISTPGMYAAAEALKALHLGLHVMIFSDNVSMEEEILLKQCALERDLLVMGPDCGTAIINGIPLGFANEVKRGDIGIVAASGTGLQEVTSLIDRQGSGISQAIGTGGRDLHQEVGGITMIQGLSFLASDRDTRVIVLISKPPSADVLQKILHRAKQAAKPVVVNFIGSGPGKVEGENLHFVDTLESAALTAATLSEKKSTRGSKAPCTVSEGVIKKAVSKLQDTQKYIRGLFSGGTFCYETMFLLGRDFGPVYSNITHDLQYQLENPWKSTGHTVVDLGDDVFTRGRPHPMIDHRLRNERILREADDPEVAVILLDIVLGHNAHADPASEIVPALKQAQTMAKGRELIFVVYICGTEKDPQGLKSQEKKLEEAGAILARSNSQAVRLSSAIVKHLENKGTKKR